MSGRTGLGVPPFLGAVHSLSDQRFVTGLVRGAGWERPRPRSRPPSLASWTPLGVGPRGGWHYRDPSHQKHAARSRVGLWWRPSTPRRGLVLGFPSSSRPAGSSAVLLRRGSHFPNPRALWRPEPVQRPGCVDSAREHPAWGPRAAGQLPIFASEGHSLPGRSPPARSSRPPRCPPAGSSQPPPPEPPACLCSRPRGASHRGTGQLRDVFLSPLDSDSSRGDPARGASPEPHPQRRVWHGAAFTVGCRPLLKKVQVNRR